METGPKFWLAKVKADAKDVGMVFGWLGKVAAEKIFGMAALVVTTLMLAAVIVWVMGKEMVCKRQDR